MRISDWSSDVCSSDLRQWRLTMSDARSSADNSFGRRRAMLRTAMGPGIAAALSDPAVIEIMVNHDGVLRLDRLGEGRLDRQSGVEGKSVSVRVDLGGRGIIKKKIQSD